MFNPGSTYRIQFNKEFTFVDFLKNAEYFSRLGIGSVYASPVFEAAPGSMHGYDVTDPHRFNPEVGTAEEYETVSEWLKSRNIGWVQDIVPNHMAFHNNNAWLMDVMEKGRNSEYAKFFDIDFSHPEFEGRLMVPFLGKTLQETIDSDEIKAEIMNGRVVLRYFDFWFPVSRESMPHEAGTDFAESVNTDKRLLRLLLDSQHYELCYWRESLEMINYRRFFTVNSLICLSMENDEVFGKYHTFIADLVKRNRFDGLRIDHVDGLKCPDLYLDKLRLLTGNETYIVTEKILGLQENLPLNMPIQGTSGYDYLGIVNNLFTRTENYPALKDFYKEITGITESPEGLIYSGKKLILTGSMNGEWENLTRMFDRSGFVTYSADVTRESIKEAIGEFLVLFPVYRIYDDSFPLSAEETGILKEVFEKASRKNPSLKKSLSVLRDLFLEQDKEDDERNNRALAFFLRCLQFTGPLMAKGVEDTVMYYYNCFIAHNEVGDHTSAEGIPVQKYHDLMTQRQRNWPLGMNGTSTHDTKRGEDMRARLNVISELPDAWIKNVKEWMKINSSFRKTIKGKSAPDPNEEYFIYQTLVGAFPFKGIADKEFLGRMDQYLEKAVREAKANSDWNEINEEHESAVKNFTREILKDKSDFLKSFLPFQKKVGSFGVINSLSQLMLKATSPGVPDFYQGTELWDLSLVDPDNRRPVDYSLRTELLAGMQKLYKKDPGKLLKDLIKNRHDGRLKLWMTHVLLEARRADPDIFLHGSYFPLNTEGKLSEHVLAFARVHGSSWIVVVIPLFIASIDKSKNEPAIIKWEDTAVLMPDLAPGSWSSPFIADELKADDRMFLSDIMKFPLPVFLRSSVEAPSRFAGVLAHLSSLPGKYGTGDLGYQAYRFADILQANGQAFWQILPFNPVNEGNAWSPYSSTSAFAGNTMFISPDILVRSGLLHEDALNNITFAESSETDFQRAIDFRNLISDEAFTGFFCSNRPSMQADFEKFCKEQEYWLDDYAFFNLLKREYDSVPWNEWPKKYRDRKKKGMDELALKFESDLKKEKFMQYLFDRQWMALKSYCNNKGIKLIGDMSFYVNYDSAEVWAHPEYFRLDASKTPVTVAGVPPDYFSETGQLWNMPVYNWARMEKDSYVWWMNRIKRNMELCDLLRFDHFRAFSEYWEVPYGDETAINGEWVLGPGHDFFNTVKQEYPDMPFIAEDLGSIDEKVYKLRDDFGLPGMAILQFAFGDNTPRSGYIPHNFIPKCIVYTGTHDNNTTKGWYECELNEKGRREAKEYVGHAIDAETCNEDFIRMAYGSVARIAIIPVQDLLGLDGSGRLNKPSTSEGNWTWKMKDGEMERMFSAGVRRMVKMYGRV